MLTFDNDDNDNNLNLDTSDSDVESQQKPSSSAASPFGKTVPNGANSAAQKKPASSSLPPRSPFGTAPKKPGTSPNSLPGKSSLPPRLPQRQTPGLPPRKTPATPAPETPAPIESKNVSPEEENYLLNLMNNQGGLFSAPAPAVPEPRFVEPEPEPVTLPPVVHAAPVKQVEEEIVPVTVSEPSPEPTKAKKGKDKSGSKKSTGKGFSFGVAKPVKKPAREKAFDGDRKNILIIRIIAGTVAGIIALAGLQSIFVPDKGPTPTQMQAVAREAVNYTGFPTVSGEQFAIDFARTYFTFNTEDDKRREKLTRYASEELVKQIDIQIIPAEEYEATRTAESPTYSDLVVSQSIIYGPYVVASHNVDANNAVFTVKVGLESGSVIYSEIPVKYNPKNYSLTLAGPPSFVKPIQNTGSTKAEEYTLDLGAGDKTIQNDFTPDMEAYLAAWALSEETIINRYLYEGATDNAKLGLQGAVRFKSLDSFVVEPFDDTRPNTAKARKAEITVTWEDSKTGLQYPQQYRVLLGLDQKDEWSIYDIENFAVLD